MNYIIVYHKKIALLLLLISGITLKSAGQVTFIPDTPIESFHLTTDRDHYISGETIWFSVKSDHFIKPGTSPLSKVIYVELFDADLRIIQQGKFFIQDGCSAGQFIIPLEQPSGIYYLRAYTQYLKNFHPNTHPLLLLTILNPSLSIPTSETLEKDIVRCYPEGGTLMAGIQASVALVLPETMSGRIQSLSLHSKDSAIIKEISFFSNGLGYFKFIPELDNSYSVHAHMTGGDSITTYLPPVYPTGISIQLKEQKDRIIYNILKNSNSPLANSKKYYLYVSKENYALSFIDSISGASPVIQFEVNKKNLGQGINYFTLHDDSGEVLDLKLHYVYPKNSYLASFHSNKPKFKAREKIDLQIELPEQMSTDTIVASIAVIKKGSLHQNQDLLPPWISYQPHLIRADMFNGQEVSPDMMMQINAALILYQNQLMDNPDLQRELTNSSLPLKHIPEIRNVSLSGYIKDNQTQDPVSGTTVFLSYIGGTTRVHVSETQPDGLFIFSLSPYHQPRDFFLCTFNENPNQEILINSDYLTDFPTITEIPLVVDTNKRRLIEELFINQQFHDLWKNKFPQYIHASETFELGFGTPDISIRLEDYIDLPSMDVVLNEIVPFVKVRKKKGNYKITILDSETGLSYENHLLLVDNIPLDNTNELMRIHPANVEQIDVINRTYVIGDHTFQGILLIKTKTENFGGISMPGDAVFIKYPLLSEQYLFPSSSYTYQKDQKYLTDFRNVLYWNPKITLGGTQSISFYASDNLTDFEVILQGNTRTGKTVYGRSLIKIQED